VTLFDYLNCSGFHFIPFSESAQLPWVSKQLNPLLDAARFYRTKFGCVFVASYC